MRTAEEWTSEIIDYELTHYDGSYKKLIQQIQLDAAKWGAEQAANRLEDEGFHRDCISEVRTFANTLTIDQLPK